MANETIYPYGTNGQLPSSIGVINDLTTGGVDKALSAEMGKEIREWLSTETMVTLNPVKSYIGVNSNKWAVNFNDYQCVLVPVESGDIYRIVANSTNGCSYAVLTSGSAVDNATPDYATGYSATVAVAAGETVTVSIPSDGTHLYISTYNADGDVSPSLCVRISIAANLHTSLLSYIVNNFTTGGSNKMLSAEMGKELHELITCQNIELRTPISAYIGRDTNKWAVNFNDYQCVLVPVESGDIYRIVANSTNGCSYAVLTSGSAVDNATPDYATGYSATVAISAGGTADVTIPTDGVYLYISVYNTADLTPASVLRIMQGYILDNVLALIEEHSSLKASIPDYLYMGEPTNIIYTIDEFLLAHEYDPSNSIDNLKFSTDLGKTWITKENTFGVLTNAFRFADGTFMMCCQQSDGMHFLWSRDFDTFNDCTVYDHNGSVYQTRANDRRGYMNRQKCYHTYYNGTEYYLFEDYVFPDSNSASSNPRLWYALSEDSGVTIRCAFAFGLSQIGGTTIPARHVHSFVYNKYDGHFYAMTGDHGTDECNVMRGTLGDNNTWTWERMAHGQKYKVMSPVFDEGNIYLITDYTDSSLVNAKGIVGCPLDRFDFDNFTYLFHATASFMLEGSISSSQPAAMTHMVTDNHGWRFMITDYIGNSKHMIAKGDHNFVWVDNTTGLKFERIFGPNAKGDVYVSTKVPSSSVPEETLRISGKQTYNLTEAMRNSGATDFFDGYNGMPY